MLFQLQQGGFGRVGGVKFLPYISTDTTLPGANNTTWHTIGSNTLSANKVYLVNYAIRFAGELGVGQYDLRIDANGATLAAAVHWGHDHQAANASGFSGGIAMYANSQMTDGSLELTQVNSSSNVGRFSGVAGSLLVTVGGADMTLRWQLLDKTTDVQETKIGAIFRSLN